MPSPITGTPYTHGPTKGTVYTATSYVKERLGLDPSDDLRLFHHSKTLWATPGEDTRISTRKSGGVYGKGFYTSTKAETFYGPNQFQLEIPVNALTDKKIFEIEGWQVKDDFVMPDGTDVLAVRQNKDVWFVFKAGSEFWVNSSSTESDFDEPGKTVAWD